MDIGTTLRTAREQRAVTLTQLASTTKIPIHILQALEQNAFEKVPRGIFIRGFLRAFATHVGLDPNLIVNQFLEESGEPAPAPPEMHRADEDALDDHLQPTPVDPDLTPSGPGWGYALVVAALLVAVIAVHRSNSEESSTPSSVSAVQAALAAADVDSAVSVQPVATAGQDSAIVERAGGGHVSGRRFDLQAQGECWLEAVVDGRRVVYRLLQPGERETIEADGEVVLRVGDPGALSYTVNGAPGKPLGRAGIPVTVRFTNQGA
jgi:cytoskeletal protein RodZ